MSKEKKKVGQADTIFTQWDNIEDRAVLSVEAIKVPGGVLYVTAHHQWGQINTTFVKDDNIQKVEQKRPHIDYEKAFKFLTNTEDKDESTQ